MASAGAGWGDITVEVGDWNDLDRRRSERVACRLPVFVRRTGALDAEAGHALDVTPYGLRIHVAGMRPRIGERLMLELECEVPVPVHLGFDLDALVIDGPLLTHVAAVPVRVVRCDDAGDGLEGWDLGLEVGLDADPEERHMLQVFVEHLQLGHHRWLS